MSDLIIIPVSLVLLYIGGDIKICKISFKDSIFVYVNFILCLRILSILKLDTQNFEFHH